MKNSYVWVMDVQHSDGQRNQRYFKTKERARGSAIVLMDVYREEYVETKISETYHLFTVTTIASEHINVRVTREQMF